MKITNKYLKQIIQEETAKLILEDNRTVGSVLDDINFAMGSQSAEKGNDPIFSLIRKIFLSLNKPMGTLSCNNMKYSLINIQNITII